MAQWSQCARIRLKHVSDKKSEDWV